MRSSTFGSVLVAAIVGQLQAAQAVTVPSDAEHAMALINQQRAAHSLAPLTWNDSLAQEATNWAAHLKATGQVVHATEAQRADQGEVLAHFTTSDPNFHALTSATQKWLAGGADYPAGAVVGNGVETWTHWSQLMWSSTTEIGCGTSQTVKGTESNTIVVCRLTPEGNIIGQAPFTSTLDRRQDMGKGPFKGDITHFTTGLGACGHDDTNKPGIVALSHKKMGARSNDNPLCDKRVKLTANGKTVYGTVRDKCMGCESEDVDVSEDLFIALYKDLGVGRAPVEWELV